MTSKKLIVAVNDCEIFDSFLQNQNLSCEKKNLNTWGVQKRQDGIRIE